jgi:hypothetical protein
MTTLHRRAVLRGAAATALGAVAGQAAIEGPASAAPAPSSSGLGTAKPLDGRPAPGYDYSRANRLPREMTGYWEKTFDVGGVTRTAKAYISPETPISHNNIPEETPMLWEFLRHYRHEVDESGRVTRYYSPSGFRRHGDETIIPS